MSSTGGPAKQNTNESSQHRYCNYELPAVIKALKDSILAELHGSLAFTGPPLVHRQSGGPGEI